MNEVLKEIKMLQLSMGRQCNVRCAMCYQRSYDSAGNMPAVIYKKYFSPLYPYLNRLVIQGGEPTIMSNCRELVQYVDRFPDIRFFFFTNGVRVDDFWMGIFKERSYAVRVSVNAASRKTYDRITKYGDFDKVIENVRQIIRGKVNKSPTVVLSTVLLRHNAHEIAEFIELGHELGVDKVKFSIDPFLSFYKVSAQDVRTELDKARKIVERTGMLVTGLNVMARYVNYPWHDERMDGRVEECRFPFTMLAVDGSGDVRICNFTWRVLGNIYKASLKEVLGNWQRTRLQQLTASGNHSWCVPYCPNNPAPKKMAQFNRYFYLFRKDPHGFFKYVTHRLDRAKHL